MNNPKKLSGFGTFLSWVLQVLASAILIQTFYYKFADSEELVYIFAQIGIEPWGRYLSGVIELLAGLLLLIPRTSWIGAIMGASVVSVAIYFHLTSLGIEIKGDGGSTFYLAITVLLSCLYIIYLRSEYIQKLFLYIKRKIYGENDEGQRTQTK